MFIGADDIITPKPIGESPLQISVEDFKRIEKNPKIIMAMIIALALLTLLKKKGEKKVIRLKLLI
jgi:hypothetical protein